MSFLEIFQPGLKHLREERDRQKMLVVRPSHGGGAPMGIDLDAGKATIAVSTISARARGSGGQRHRTCVSLRRDRPRQLREAVTCQHRDTHGHHEVDCIAHLAAAVHAGTVLPGRQRGLGARIPTVLNRRCRTQRAEVSGSSSSAITDGVSRDHQGGTAKRHNDAEDPGHKDRCAAKLGARRFSA